ncbi:uncharacterized protein C57A10.07-like [Olea europaea subsp. europaea]|uniref:Uncharacterized protein C57A10.07-like n=1 Tax=Olea europaea subsp. europaea TaxID=158383 RepID=A0A8S0UAI3_OLEEU|nr:uncharacterized protein C57A10.07-like [Olea europaea subsp. europaea]
MKTSYSLGSSNSPKSFQAYPRGDFDLESGIVKKSRKPKKSPIKMLSSLGNRIQYYYKLHPLMLFLICLSLGITILIILYGSPVRMMPYYKKLDANVYNYPFSKFKNLVMVAGHSIYTSSSCEKVDKEDSWFLESYQRHPGQAATFVTHIRKGVEIAANDDEALLLFSGGETRKDAGPRSEAQSYWVVAESKGWFGEWLSCVYFLAEIIN